MSTDVTQKSVFYIAYHYPPILGSSGVHRTLAFTRHLNQQGWHVRVMTTSVEAYQNWDVAQQSFIPEGVEVIRAFARDTSRHFAWKGRYPGFLALPDKWQSWILGGVVSGMISIWRAKPDVIVSTYPIASAQIIGFVLHRLSGVPWVADLRDPMAQDDYPTDPRLKRIFEWIERKILKHASKALVTAPGAKDFYQQKYPSSADDFWVTIPNGYDAQMFAGLKSTVAPDKASEAPLVLLHSGVIYPSERDPSEFFAALSELKTEGVVDSRRLIVRLRATGHDGWLHERAAEFGVDDLIVLEPPIPYRDALQEMLDVDGLLLLQAENCNYQIPAKAYEYIRVQKPVLALTPPEGDTGKLFSGLGYETVAALHDKAKIKAAVKQWFLAGHAAKGPSLGQDQVDTFSRQNQAANVADMLAAIAGR